MFLGVCMVELSNEEKIYIKTAGAVKSEGGSGDSAVVF